MRFTTFKAEQNLAELVQRLFQTKGVDAATLPKEAEAAHLRANPQLRNLKKFLKEDYSSSPLSPASNRRQRCCRSKPRQAILWPRSIVQ